MLRYAIEDESKFDIKQNSKYISIVSKDNVLVSSYDESGIYFWPDDGTILIAINRYAGYHPVNMIYNKQELILDTSDWPQPTIRPGTEVAIIVPVATAYYGSIELENIRPEWFLATDLE